MRVALRLCLLAAFGIAASCSNGDVRATPQALKGALRASLRATAQLPRDKQKRRHDATVYVDGNPIAFVKFHELPAALRPVAFPAGDKRKDKAPRFRVVDYFDALGVDVARIRQAHFYGGRGRVAVVDGAELRAKRAIFMFRFTAADRGNLRMEWPGRDELEMDGSQTDIVSDIAIYIDRAAPAYDVKDGKVLDENGKPFKGIPFAPLERPGGTRVYLDGRFVSAIKRKTLPDSVVVQGTTETGKTHFSLTKYLEMVGIDASKLKGLEVISREEIVATRGGDALARELGTLEFVMPKESKGLIELTALKPDTKLEAILLYTSKLPERGVDPAKTGSSGAQGTPANSPKSGVATAARAVH